MTSFETALVLIAWIVLLTLGALVLLLYRQVNRAYALAAGPRVKSLDVGSKAPPLPIILGGRQQHLQPAEGLWVLLFSSPTCAHCTTLSKEILTTRGVRYPTVIAQTVGEVNAEVKALVLENSEVTMVGVADHSELYRNWGVGDVPFAYVLNDDQILNGGQVSTLTQLRHLVRLSRGGGGLAPEADLALMEGP